MRINGQQWANGVSVGVYPDAAWVDPSHAPSGAAVVLGTVANGAVTFDDAALVEKVRYVAYAAGKGVRFLVPEHSPTDSDRSRIAELEAAIAALLASIGGGEASLLPDLFVAGSLSGQGNNPYWLWMRGDVLFCTFTNDGFVKAYDVSNVVPVLLGTCASVGAAGFIGGYGNYLYCADQNTLHLKVIDATNPASMSVVADLLYDSAGSSGGARLGVSPDGQHLMIGGPESGVNDNRSVLVSIANPLAPVVVGTVTSGLTIRGVCAIDNTHWALASRDDATVRVINTTNPAAPVEVASIDLVGDVNTSVNMDGTILYVGGFGTGVLEAWDVAVPTSPVFLGSVATPIGIEQTALDTVNKRAYCGCRTAGKLAVVDISDPTHMTLIDSIAVNGTVTPGAAVHSSGNYAYMTAAGDSANGKIFVILVQPTISRLVDAVQAQVASLDLAIPKLAGANTFTAQQTLSAAAKALKLSGTEPGIQFGANVADTLKMLAAANLRFDGTLTLLSIIMFNAGAMLRSKVAEGDADFAFTLNGNGEMRWGDRTNAPDVRLLRPGADRLQLGTGDSLEIGTATDPGGNFIQFFEQSADPAAGAANTARLFSKDNGSGKTQLVCRFPSGATQVIATEP